MQFTKKTSSSSSFLVLAIKMGLVLVVVLGVIFLLNKIDFPAPKKEIEKIIPNENFKIVK
jgi:cell division protein FtsN|tara:strand:+ start:492 stop:671 length:180 start_codon:yes stop_codon:yes gene_type:complete